MRSRFKLIQPASIIVTALCRLIRKKEGVLLFHKIWVDTRTSKGEREAEEHWRRTVEKEKKAGWESRNVFSPAARVFYISLMFSNARRVLSQCKIQLTLLHLLYDIEVMWRNMGFPDQSERVHDPIYIIKKIIEHIVPAFSNCLCHLALI